MPAAPASQARAAAIRPISLKDIKEPQLTLDRHVCDRHGEYNVGRLKERCSGDPLVKVLIDKLSAGCARQQSYTDEKGCGVTARRCRGRRSV